MADEQPHSAPIHPRILGRLGDTLSAHLRDIESLRCKVRALMTQVRGRIDCLETTFGLPLEECRSECDGVLESIDTLVGPTLPAKEEIDALIERVVRLSAMVSSIDRAGFTCRSRRDGWADSG